MNSIERYSRQRDLLPPDRLNACAATVVGVGAIGRQVALQLTAMGVCRLQMVDFDTVEESNIASQGYREEDLGRLKVEATADACRQINSQANIEPIADRFRRSLDIGSAVFCAVDSVEIRRAIWTAVQDRVSFFVDGRMSAETLRVLTACDAVGRESYPDTLFTPAEAYVGSCTAKSTIYCANIAAGVMLAQFAKWLRGFAVDPDIQLNLLANELTVCS